MTLKITRVAVATALVALAAQTALAANVHDQAKIMSVLDRWESAAAARGTDPAVWRDMMRIQLEQASPATLDKLLAISSAEKKSFGALLDILGADITARLEKVAPKALGSTTSDQVFTPITPCRVVDTRNLGGAIGPFATRNFFFFTTTGSTNWNSIQGGVNAPASSGCPGTVITAFNPSSAVATITVTGQGGSGNLIVWQGTNPVASASTMSYPASGDTSSLATIPWGGRSGTGPGGSVQDFGVFVNAFTATNVVVDIVGYYGRSGATALDCVTTAVASVSVGAGSWNSVSSPTCAAGYTLTGGACGTSGFGNFLTDSDANSTSWFCGVNNTGGSAITLNARARCCRVPGY